MSVLDEPSMQPTDELGASTIAATSQDLNPVDPPKVTSTSLEILKKMEVSKVFPVDNKAYKGTITNLDMDDPEYPFHVTYEDTDEEDLSATELLEILLNKTPEVEALLNAYIAQQQAKKKASRGRASEASAMPGAKRGPGRPRKTANLNDASPTKAPTGRPRGRPRKNATPSSSAPATTPTKKAGAAKRGPGRPRKETPSSPAAKRKARETASPMASPPAKRGRGRPPSTATAAVPTPTIRRSPMEDANLRYSKYVMFNNLMMISSQRTDDPTDTTVAGQTTQVLAQIDKILQDAGLTKKNLLRVTVLMTDMNQFMAMHGAWDKWVDPENAPVRNIVEVQKLNGEQYKIEVSAEAGVL